MEAAGTRGTPGVSTDIDLGAAKFRSSRAELVRLAQACGGGETIMRRWTRYAEWFGTLLWRNPMQAWLADAGFVAYSCASTSCTLQIFRPHVGRLR